MKKTQPIVLYISFFVMLMQASLGGASTLKPAWHQHYHAIEDETAYRYMTDMLDSIASILGQPSVDLNQVLLRLSTPINHDHTLKKNFQLTETADAEHGLYVIYVSQAPGHPAFEGQFFHEISHLFNPNIHDAYFEGLCTLLAQKKLKELGKNTAVWDTYWESGQDPFYSQTYFMMKEIYEAVGQEYFRGFHNITGTTQTSSQHEYIDIHQWLSKLPPAYQTHVKAIIQKYAAPIRQAIQTSHPHISFQLPI